MTGVGCGAPCFRNRPGLIAGRSQWLPGCGFGTPGPGFRARQACPSAPKPAAACRACSLHTPWSSGLLLSNTSQLLIHLFDPALTMICASTVQCSCLQAGLVHGERESVYLTHAARRTLSGRQRSAAAAGIHGGANRHGSACACSCPDGPPPGSPVLHPAL